MEALLALAFVVLLIALIGHGIWVFIRFIIRLIIGKGTARTSGVNLKFTSCPNCRSENHPNSSFCQSCGAPQKTGMVTELLRDLAATERQAERFWSAGALEDEEYQNLKQRIEAERSRLNAKITTTSGIKSQDSSAAPAASILDKLESYEAAVVPPSVIDHSDRVASAEKIIPITPEPAWMTAASTPSPPQEPTQQRRTFTEVLTAFMEESNIRWGEIIGGLLIIGCSTALVVSLWAQISSIPVLKFLIFTTVTAALFGVGLYTEHRWKLPTTSRGVLTIATLLVPLNFLAIAAVSSSALPQGSLVIASELIAPAVFLCLVYFAGGVLTPKWPHLLATGVLGSSIGQLLIRHLAAPDNAPAAMLALGALPIIFFVATAAWMLWIAMADSEIDEEETIAIFISLGALTFAAVLPFGLLLYKSGPVPLSMMYLAPLVSLGGVPILFSGTILWKRVTARQLVASRVAGTSIAILGTLIVLAGMILAWPNPAGIVPAALLNCVVLIAIAIVLDLPYAHLPAVLCFSLAYVVFAHVVKGLIPWQNLRVVSLLKVTEGVSTGQALMHLFVPCIAASIWMRRRHRVEDGRWYFIAACVLGLISLVFLTSFGFNTAGDPGYLWFYYLFFAFGSFVLAQQSHSRVFSWTGTFLLLIGMFHALGPWLSESFPWQTALLFHATICAIAALLASQIADRWSNVFVDPLNKSALITSGLALICLWQANPWETTGMQAERVLWLAGVWLLSLWLNRAKRLFTIFQIALSAALILAIKAALQQYDWYSYLPHAFLHPIALQIQGTTLLLLTLLWIGLRFVMVRVSNHPFKEESGATNDAAGGNKDWLTSALRLLNTGFAFDRIVPWILLGGFGLLVIYGTFSGLKQELTALGSTTASWDIAGYPHRYALGLGSWIVLGLLVISMMATLFQQRKSIYLLGAVVALGLASPLLAGLWEEQIATASAWRWLAAIFLVLASLPLWFREYLRRKNFNLAFAGEVPQNVFNQLRGLLLVTNLTPLLIFTLYAALRAIYYQPVHGPGGGIFHSLGDTISYSLPVVIVALVLIVYAVRDRLVSHAFYGGLFLNLAVTMVLLLSVVAVQGEMNRVVVVRLVQLNAITCSLYAILWLTMKQRWEQRIGAYEFLFAQRLFKLQLGVTSVALFIIMTTAVIFMIRWPFRVGIGTASLGGVHGWLAFILTAVALGMFLRIFTKPVNPAFLCAVLLFMSYLASITTGSLGWSGWEQFHVLIFGVVATAGSMAYSRYLPKLSLTVGKDSGWLKSIVWSAEWEWQTSLFASLMGGAAVMLALREAAVSQGGWWAVGTIIVISALAAALNWQTLRQEFLFGAAFLVALATSLWWWKFGAAPALPEVDFLTLNISAGCAAGVIWLLLQLRARRLRAATEELKGVTDVHHYLAIGSLILMSWVSLLVFGSWSDGHPVPETSFSLAWMALGSLAVLLVACIWDRLARYAVAGLYLLGLMIGALALVRLNLSLRHFAWAFLMLMSVYSILGGLLWGEKRRLIEFATQLRIPPRLESNATHLRWLQLFTAVLVISAGWLAYYIDIRFSEWALRISAALGFAFGSIAIVLVASKTPAWRKAALAFLALGLVLFGWAWLVPFETSTWLNRAVIVMIEMFAIVAVFGLALDKVLKREPDWTRAVRECVPWMTGAGVTALAFVLCTELSYQLEFGTVRVSGLALTAIGLTLASATAICVLFALSPEHDPLSLPEAGRRRYVYVAELMLALLFMHLRLTMPWLFTGFFERYWPVVIVAIAYLGVAVSELLRRRNVLVLAHPIERTGAFLPLLPVLGFWVTRSEVDYSILLFIVGGLYGLLAILRSSFMFGILAVIAGNGGLWYLWHRTAEYGFLQHPQLWLIPVAISVLIAAYLNREALSEDQLIGIRYLSLIVIYISSTADIFINGVDRSPWLPLVLAALALAGIFGGIVMRIRAFLLLGSIFLLFSVTTMIYYASVNLGWTWLWYVAGIFTGAMIIFTFALFEKKREEMLRVVEGFKEWQR